MRNYYIILLTVLFFTIHVSAQVTGCTDPLSTNYNPEATVNDGSCVYSAVSESPEYSVQLPDDIQETSGLIAWGNYLYTHNDDTDVTLYGIDSTTGDIQNTYDVTGATNIDWEEIAQDENYIYIGDFGNNSNGNRTNLKIIKVAKEQLLNGNPELEYINFSYSNQTDFTATGGNNTNFDCEAFIVSQNNIYLFTKQWVNQETSVYELPKIAGTYTAELKTTYNVEGLITGATYLEDKQLVVLCGYSAVLQPFFFLLYDFEGYNFFEGNKRKIQASVPFHQTEGITTTNGIDYYVSNERFTQGTVIDVPQKLHYYDLSAYLDSYIESVVLNVNEVNKELIQIYPNPAFDVLNVKLKATTITNYSIIDVTGKKVIDGLLNDTTHYIDVSQLTQGIYFIKIDAYPAQSLKFIKIK